MGFLDTVMDDWLGDPLGSYHQADAAKNAGIVQAQQADAGIEETRRQFDIARYIQQPFVDIGLDSIAGLAPYQSAGVNSVPSLEGFVNAGNQALDMEQALAGLLGPEKQLEAIQMIEDSPEMASMINQGEEAILQNASATGGLRGGNTQRALMEFRPEVLSSLINKKYDQLSGIAGRGGNAGQTLAQLGSGITQNLYSGGQASASNQAQGALNTGVNIASLLGEKGAAEAGSMIAESQGQGSGLRDAIDIAEVVAEF